MDEYRNTIKYIKIIPLSNQGLPSGSSNLPTFGNLLPKRVKTKTRLVVALQNSLAW